MRPLTLMNNAESKNPIIARLLIGQKPKSCSAGLKKTLRTFSRVGVSEKVFTLSCCCLRWSCRRSTRLQPEPSLIFVSSPDASTQTRNNYIKGVCRLYKWCYNSNLRDTRCIIIFFVALHCSLKERQQSYRRVGDAIWRILSGHEQTRRRKTR